jgi:hypothetical protein
MPLNTAPPFSSIRLTREAAHANVKPMFDCYHFWSSLNKFEDPELIHTAEVPHFHFQDVPDIPRELLDMTARPAKCRERASLHYPAFCALSPRRDIPARYPSSSSIPITKTPTLTKWSVASARRRNP